MPEARAEGLVPDGLRERRSDARRQGVVAPGPPQAVGPATPFRIRKPPKVGERGYRRRKGDAYFTKPWVTAAGLQKITPRGIVWECACGIGNMTRVLEEHGHQVVSTDISRRRYDGLFARMDFLKTSAAPHPGVETIFTNPPNSLADAFAYHAIELMRPVGGLVVMLFDHGYVAAGPTKDFLFDAPMPFAAWIVVTKRPKWIDEPKRVRPEDKKKQQPRRNYAFGVWDWQHRGPPIIARVR